MDVDTRGRMDGSAEPLPLCWTLPVERHQRRRLAQFGQGQTDGNFFYFIFSLRLVAFIAWKKKKKKMDAFIECVDWVGFIGKRLSCFLSDGIRSDSRTPARVYKYNQPLAINLETLKKKRNKKKLLVVFMRLLSTFICIFCQKVVCFQANLYFLSFLSTVRLYTPRHLCAKISSC